MTNMIYTRIALTTLSGHLPSLHEFPEEEAEAAPSANYPRVTKSAASQMVNSDVKTTKTLCCLGDFWALEMEFIQNNQFHFLSKA